MTPATARRQILLEFTPSTVGGEKKKPRKFRDSLSAVEFADDGRTLFLGVDETVNAAPTIERLTQVGDGYAAHQPLPVQDFLELPNPQPNKGRVGELDIEGIAVHGGYLWLVGSHSSRRKKAKAKAKRNSPAEDLARLAKVDLDPNRLVLGRIPLVEGPDGTTLTKRDGERTSARLVDDLRETLADDPIVGPFLHSYKNHAGDRVSIPGKDNGFDIEGLVVQPGKDDTCRVLLGLRGPVVRGWAIIVELLLAPGSKPDQLVLSPPAGAGKALYRKHLVRLEGLGIRDLRQVDDTLFILAGPTMMLNGEVVLYRWLGGTEDAHEDTLTDLAPGRLERVLRLPSGDHDDRPEGLTFLPSGELLVVYDGPADARLSGETGVRADVFAFPPQPNVTEA